MLLAEADQYSSDSKIDMILEDFQDLADESLDGVDRIKTIVKDLKTFSRLEGDEKK